MNQGSIVIPFLSKFELFQVHVPGNGDCFFHAVLSGYSKSYNQNHHLRIQKARKMREDLAEFLKSDVVSDHGENKGMIYHHLAGGNLPSFGEVDPDYTIDGMCNWLRSNRFVGTEMTELLSLYININIFIIDLDDLDLIIHGRLEDWYDPDRTNIVVFYRCIMRSSNIKDVGGHFDLCKVKHTDGSLVSHLKSTHSFIKAIIDRYNYRVNHKV